MSVYYNVVMCVSTTLLCMLLIPISDARLLYLYHAKKLIPSRYDKIHCVKYRFPMHKCIVKLNKMSSMIILQV